MSYMISLMVMFVIAGCFGMVASLWHNRLRNEEKKINNVIVYMFYTCILMVILNIYRWSVGRGDVIVLYSDDILMFAVDILLSVSAAILLPFLYQVCYRGGKKGRIRIYALYIGLFLVLWISSVIKEYWLQYRNFKSAIYDNLLPGKLMVVGGIALLTAHLSAKVYALCNKTIGVDDDQSLAVQYWMKYMTDSRSKGSRIKESQWVLVLYLVTCWIYPFAETYFLNSSEWLFGLGDICFSVLLLWVMLYLLLVFVFANIRGKLWYLFQGILFAISIAAYIQAMFLNNNLFVMDGNALEWSVGLRIGNVLVWGVVVALIIVCKRFLEKQWKSVVNYLSFALVAMQLVACISLLPTFLASEAGSGRMQQYLSTNGLYSVGEEENVIVFVLDTYDVDYLKAVMEEDEAFLEELQGFIYYPDAVAQFSRTTPSITYLLTQQLYFRDIPYTEYVEKAFGECDFWDRLQQAGYSYDLYEEDEESIALSVRKNAGNYVEQGTIIEKEISFTGCVRAIANIANYRVLPYLWKNYFSYTASDINNLIIERNIWDNPPYIIDDAEFNSELVENGLVFGEDKKQFKFFHLNGCHAPYTLNAEGERVERFQTSPVEQYKGCMQIVYNYLEKLRAIGGYDNSTIIITTDHGENFVAEELAQNTNPIIFVKPAGVSAGELEIKNIPVSQEDILCTISEVLGLDASLDGINLMEQTEEPERIRYHYYAVVEGTEQVGIATYEITGNSLEFENWHKTDEFYEFVY